MTTNTHNGRWSHWLGWEAGRAWLDEPTLADAILDRVVHGSHKLALKGESMRKLAKAA